MIMGQLSSAIIGAVCVFLSRDALAGWGNSLVALCVAVCHIPPVACCLLADFAFYVSLVACSLVLSCFVFFRAVPDVTTVQYC
jgi:hypothetical protein